MNAFPPINDFMTFLDNRRVAENTRTFIAMFATVVAIAVEFAVAAIGEWWVNGGKEQTVAMKDAALQWWANTGKVKLLEFAKAAKQTVQQWWVNKGKQKATQLAEMAKVVAVNEINYIGFIAKEWWNDTGKVYAVATVNQAKVAMFTKAL